MAYKNYSSAKAWRDRNKEHIRLSGKSWRDKNKERVDKNHKEWYAKNRETVLLGLKNKHRAMTLEESKAFTLRLRTQYAKHRIKRLASHREYYQRWRDEFLKEYGDKCSCCGESEKGFLTLEHLNGDGKQHRASVSRNPVSIFIDLKKRGWPKDAYTILCFNCNHSKFLNKGTCSHVITKARMWLAEIVETQKKMDTMDSEVKT